MEDYGETFRKIRIDKGYSLKETAEGIVSTQFLSKFEKGESSITVPKLNDLLNKILVSWKEFMRLHNGNNLDSVNRKTGEVGHFIYSNNFYELDKIGKYYDELYRDSQSNKDLHMSLIIKASYYANIDKEITQDKLMIIRDYLKSVDQWCDYENYLFGSFIQYLSDDDIMLHYRRVARNFEKNQKDFADLSMENIQLVSFIISHFVNQRKLDLALEVLDHLGAYMLKENDPVHMFYKLIFKSKISIIKILQGEVEQGKSEIEGYMRALELIGGYPVLVNNMFKDLQQALEEVKGNQ